MEKFGTTPERGRPQPQQWSNVVGSRKTFDSPLTCIAAAEDGRAPEASRLCRGLARLFGFCRLLRGFLSGFRWRRVAVCANETFGHIFGDQLFGQRVGACFREGESRA